MRKTTLLITLFLGSFAVCIGQGVTKPTESVTQKYTIIPDSGFTLMEVEIKPQKQRNKERYKRKNNPAVIIMQTAIRNKEQNDARKRIDFLPFKVYRKIDTSLDNVVDDKLKGLYKLFPEMRNHTEQTPVDALSDEYVLPLNIDESAYKAQTLIKRSKMQKSLEGSTSIGFTNLLTLEDAVNRSMQNAFSDMDIYENQILLMNNSYMSPIGDNATRFYKYYVVDTVTIGTNECVHLFFTPMNSLDFGFNGDIYLTNDSALAVRQLKMRLPRHHALNFAQGLWVTQDFEQMPGGGWALSNDDFAIKLYLFQNMQGLFIHRNTSYFDYNKEVAQSNDSVKAEKSNDLFWDAYRKMPLSDREKNVVAMFDTIMQKPGVKPTVYIGKSLVENFFETAPLGEPSYFDIGPIYSTLSGNNIEGLRIRLGGQTTANLSPHLFVKGWVAYGCRDQRFKGMGNIAYSFKPCKHGINDFPKHYISATYRYDLESPTDQFLAFDKDHFMYLIRFKPNLLRTYNRTAALDYEYETDFNLTTSLNATYQNLEAAGSMIFQPNTAGAAPLHDITHSSVKLALRFAPGEEFIADKERRVNVNDEAPVISLSHTMGISGFLGGQYNSNLTELSIFKKVRFGSWGDLDTYIKGSIQWNQVPYPLLIIPVSNNSMFVQKNTFSLLNTMEFLNDRSLSVDLTYHLEGKLMNQIPLIKKLKIKEVFGFKMLWGGLSEMNDPYRTSSDKIFSFPSISEQGVSVMNPQIPYMEFSVGLYNILKFMRIDYVHRITYRDLPGAQRWGIRLGVDM